MTEREMRVAARKGALYRDRVIVALLGLVFSGWSYIFLRQMGGPFRGPIGAQTFQALTNFCLVFSLFTGFGACDSLSSEKREGTMGLLFLTDLTAWDIVLGKLVAHSTGYFYALLAMVPVLTVPLTLGGVEPRQVFRMSLVLLNTVFLSMSIGLFASSTVRNRGAARNNCMALITIFWVFLPGIAGILRLKGAAAWAYPFELFAPSHAKDLAMGSTPAPFDRFWLSLGLIHLAAWILLALAGIILPRAWQDRPVRRPLLERVRLTAGVRSRVVHDPRRLRAHLLDRNAFSWLASRDSWDPRATVIAFAIVIGTGVVFYAKTYRVAPEPILPCLVAGILHLAFRFRLAESASRRIIKEREAGTMEWLLSTPLTVPEIISGQLRALRHQLGPAFCITLLVDLIAYAVFMRTEGGLSFLSEGSMQISLTFLAAMSIFALDSITLAYLSMWMSLKARVARKATGEAVGRVLALPWVLFGLSLMIGGLIDEFFGLHIRPGYLFVLAVWFVICAAVDLFYWNAASRKLHLEFRARAVERFDSAPAGWLARLFKRKPAAPPVIAMHPSGQRF